MLNFNSIMIGSIQPKGLAEFYEKVLGKPADNVNQDSGFWGWQVDSAYLSVLSIQKWESYKGSRARDV